MTWTFLQPPAYMPLIRKQELYALPPKFPTLSAMLERIVLLYFVVNTVPLTWPQLSGSPPHVLPTNLKVCWALPYTLLLFSPLLPLGLRNEL